MRVCPQCGSHYTDDALQFCLQDGTRLRPLETAPNVTENEFETVVRRRETDDVVSEPRRSNTGVIVALTALLTAFLLIVGGIGTWLLLKNNSTPSNQNQARTTPTASVSPTPTPSPSASVATPEPTPAVSPVDSARAQREVTKFIAEWKNATEAKDIDAFGGQYADQVAYYNDPSASRDQVQNDKRRAFSIYDHIRIDISNMNTNIASDGESAVSMFDKEWEFVGDNGNSRGKVRSELRLKRINGKWKIVGERDQKVYHVE